MSPADSFTEYLHTLCGNYKIHNSLTEEARTNSYIKRGLRNDDGTGVMVGLTRICNVEGYYIDDGEKVPKEGVLKYRGLDINDIIEGRLIADYYDHAGGNDVIFIGDCECYENISPIKMWEEYGITSYIRGSAQQLIWQSYYLLEETLKYETPKAVVFNVLSMKYNEPQNEARHTNYAC